MRFMVCPLTDLDAITTPKWILSQYAALCSSKTGLRYRRTREVGMKNISLWILLAVALLLPDAMPLDCLAYQQSRKTIAVKSVTGSYKYVLNTVEVLELPDHRVRISFSGFWPNDHKRVETRNVGSFDETVPLKGHTAEVKVSSKPPDLTPLEKRTSE